jgi:hypothetical protein
MKFKNGGLIKMKRVANKQDTDILLYSGTIMVKDGYVVWLKPDYKGVCGNIKKLAGQFKLKIDQDGIYEI